MRMKRRAKETSDLTANQVVIVTREKQTILQLSKSSMRWILIIHAIWLQNLKISKKKEIWFKLTLNKRRTWMYWWLRRLISCRKNKKRTSLSQNHHQYRRAIRRLRWKIKSSRKSRTSFRSNLRGKETRSRHWSSSLTWSQNNQRRNKEDSTLLRVMKSTSKKSIKWQRTTIHSKSSVMIRRSSYRHLGRESWIKISWLLSWRRSWLRQVAQNLRQAIMLPTWARELYLIMRNKVRSQLESVSTRLCLESQSNHQRIGAKQK